MVYFLSLSEGGALGETRGKGAGRRTRTVNQDWVAWIPPDMSGLFETACRELESSNIILSMTINDALDHCKSGRWETANDRTVVFAGLFDRLAIRVLHVIRAIRDHGSHFGTLPNVEPLSSLNFRGVTAQKIARTSNLLARIVFAQRSRFFHKLQSIDEIVGELQLEMRAVLAEVPDEEPGGEIWQLLEVIGYDMSTCVEETKIVLKSFFCALPPEELGSFREKLVGGDPTLLGLETNGPHPFES
jgi:hypothetical protein